MGAMRNILIFLTLASVLAACSDPGIADPPSIDQEATAEKSVFVQLFEWNWPDVALECEQFLGPAGYAAVQVSPASEHIPGDQWWVRYQPVSYRLESRSGDRKQFADMVQRCKAAGVDIYADAVINHMATVGEGKGVAGSAYSRYQYPVPYEYDDFHHCGRNATDVIENYQDLWEVQNCELSNLADLDTGSPAVQEKIAAYLNDLLGLGVAGFRMDAAKHMSVEDLTSIIALLDRPAHIYQEVIDRGGEPINAHDYLPNGLVSEFKYPTALLHAFSARDLRSLKNFAGRPGFLPADRAIVFVDNHDIQRGHAGAVDVLNYKDGKLYELAVVFMLGHSYGNPMVMSSYRFDDGDQGPPGTAPINAITGACDDAWVCEHRNPAISAMVSFHNHTAGSAVTNWQELDVGAIAFSRGSRGFLAINAGEQAVTATVATNLVPGEYCNTLSGCDGTAIPVQQDGSIDLTLAPQSAVAIRSD
jgi:alpha-amylase